MNKKILLCLSSIGTEHPFQIRTARYLLVLSKNCTKFLKNSGYFTLDFKNNVAFDLTFNQAIPGT
jgi:hypothetical protein